MLEDHKERPLTLTQMARYLRVPAAWLREQADQGLLPHVRAGTGLLFDRQTIEQIIARRAATATYQERGDEKGGSTHGA